MNILSASKYLLAFVSIALLAGQVSAKEDEIYTGTFSSTALSGYDAVAYFTEQKPVEGKKKWTYKYKGAKWRFSSQANLDAFKADPDKYAPQYGGYCAWAVAHGVTAKGDPKQWHIHEGKLYLNISKDIKRQWLQDKVAKIEAADQNWPSVLD